MTFEIPQVVDLAANKIIQENTLSTGLCFTLTKHNHIRNNGQIRLNAQGRWQLTNLAGDLEWKDLARYPSRSRNSHTTPVTRVFNLVLDPPDNIVILTPSNKLCISASLGYHMRYELSPENRLKRTGGMPVYTQRDALQIQGLPEFARGLVQWGQGAVTGTNDGGLTFDQNKAMRRGRNLFHDQSPETLSNIIETLPTTEDNMRLLQGWKQVDVIHFNHFSLRAYHVTDWHRHPGTPAEQDPVTLL